ncbi:MAG TPA: 50S ribosomal protein L25 [Acidimicrobiales bacterium]|nr:50S ribosomal protein L25 [Acidimicrobiales bacterium]
MPEIALAAEVGRPSGSRAAKRLRRAGKIPGVVYGHGAEPVPVAVDARSLRAALTTGAGLNALLDLQVDGTSHLTLAREVQRDPVRGTVLHVDFLIVRRDEVISADIPINLVGEAEELHRNDGVVDQQLFTLSVESTPDRIPPSVDVDVTSLVIGDTVRVGDLRLPEGVTAVADPEAAVVSGQPPQVTEEDLVTEAEAAAAEAEAEAAAAEEAEAEAAGVPAEAEETVVQPRPPDDSEAEG